MKARNILIILGAIILIWLFLIPHEKPEKTKDTCTEKIFDAAIRFAETMPQNMNISEILNIAKPNKKKLIKRTEIAIMIYC